jgi:hypothetical protein
MTAASFFAVTASVLLLAGCEALAPMFGAGVGAAFNKDGQKDLAEDKKKEEAQVVKTFTQPLQRTKSAAIHALKRMAIEVDPGSAGDGQRIVGKTKEHVVEIELAAVTQKATRMKVKVGEGDKATAEEIVEQTQLALTR